MKEYFTEINGEVLAQIVLTIPCESCKVDPGEHCKERGGEVLGRSLLQGLPVRVHVQRIAPVWVVYKIGYRAGRRDEKDRQLNRRKDARQPGTNGEAAP